MRNNVILYSIWAISLLLAQIVVFNNMNLFGYLNPYPYILFLLLYPFTGNRSLFIGIAFLYGLVMDIFGNSGGIHAAACLTLAYYRVWILRFAFGLSYEYQSLKLSKVSLYERFVYISLLVLIHHFVLFSLEVFSFDDVVTILKKVIVSGLFTVLLCLMFTIIFSGYRKS